MDEKRRPGRPKGQPKTGGRVAGVRNRATREREAHLSEMLLAERLTEDEIASLSAVQVLMRIMRAEVPAIWPARSRRRSRSRRIRVLGSPARTCTCPARWTPVIRRWYRRSWPRWRH
jgi:DNA invertase Pin-like site-specific DNA recombinase